jgi:broad specificity phosphatase PhoE
MRVKNHPHTEKSVSTTSRVIAFTVAALTLLAGNNRVVCVQGFDGPGALSMSATSTNPNLLPKAKRLQTSFIVLRHGQSVANVEGIISSRPDVSIHKHGLTEAGREQAVEAGAEILSKLQYLQKEEHPANGGRTLEGVAIVCSDYKRAKETADIVAECIMAAQGDLKVKVYYNAAVVDERLRERGFGDLHGLSDDNYQQVWTLDSKDSTHTEWNVESTNSVLRRTTELVCEMEEKLKDECGSDKGKFWACVLVAHGDVLQILQTAFANINVKQHRTLLHLKTAVPRDLILTTDQDQVG